MWCGPTFVAGRGALDFNNRYILGFSLALCLVCSTAVSALAVGLKERQEANRVLDMKVNILKVARLVEGENALYGWVRVVFKNGGGTEELVNRLLKLLHRFFRGFIGYS